MGCVLPIVVNRVRDPTAPDADRPELESRGPGHVAAGPRAVYWATVGCCGGAATAERGLSGLDEAVRSGRPLTRSDATRCEILARTHLARTQLAQPLDLGINA